MIGTLVSAHGMNAAQGLRVLKIHRNSNVRVRAE